MSTTTAIENLNKAINDFRSCFEVWANGVNARLDALEGKTPEPPETDDPGPADPGPKPEPQGGTVDQATRTFWFPTGLPNNCLPIRQGERVKPAVDGLFVGGRRFKAWGFNLTFWAGMARDFETIERNLDNAVRAGFNACRIHLLDLDDGANLFHLPGRKKWIEQGKIATTRTLDPEAMARLFLLLKALRDRNLRYTFTIHHRRLLADSDRVPQIKLWDEMHAAPISGDRAGETWGWFWWDEGLRLLWKEFATSLLRAVNPHTGQAIGDDEALFLVGTNNEMSLVKRGGWGPAEQRPISTAIFQQAMAPGMGKGKPAYFEQLAAVEEAFCRDQFEYLRDITQAMVTTGTYFGDAPWSAIPPFARTGDVVSFNFYSGYRQGDTNNFLPRPDAPDKITRFGAMAGAAAWPAKRRLCLEYAPVPQYRQGGQLRRDPDEVQEGMLKRIALDASRQDLDGMFLYCYGHGDMSNLPGPNDPYNFRDSVLIREAPEAAQIFLSDPAANQYAYTIPLNRDRLWGVGTGPDYVSHAPWNDPQLLNAPFDARIVPVVG